MGFMNEIKNEASKVLTENGAVGYSTTGKALVDFNFKLPSYRGDKNLLMKDFTAIVDERDPYLLKYLFYLRDCREGLGERDAFRRTIVKALRATTLTDEEKQHVIYMIPVFGRWDDLLAFVDTEFENVAFEIIRDQFELDAANMLENKSVSLLAKWLPSDNASSKQSRYAAHKLARYLGVTVREYRSAVVALRKYLDVTEVKTCANEWDEIDYNKVSSNANLRYMRAFLKHDEDRRREYLAALERGDENAVMHSATNFPHDVVHKYTENHWHISSYDAAIEALWNNLPDMPGLNDTLVVRDGSGSMESTISGSSVTALDVADAITLYCADRCRGEFKNQFITFSSRPEFVSVVNCKTLHDKLEYLHTYDDCSNTDLEATFDLIIRAAVNGNMKQEELPKQILIISDMEFDQISYHYSNNKFKVLMEEISNTFKAAGYTMPKLVFWNVNSRTNTIPMKENAAGVLLVSGFSVNTINMVLSGKFSAYEAIVDTLEKERYNEIPYAKF